MIKLYVPNEEELEIVKFKKELYRKEHVPLNEAVEQKDLIIALIHAIRAFDYYYHYSDSATTWRAGEERYKLISDKISKVEDEKVRIHLSYHFNSEKCANVGSIYPWPKYMYRLTPYIRLFWETGSHNRACWLLGLEKWVNDLKEMSKEGMCDQRVVYSNNIDRAVQLIRFKDYWFKTTLKLEPIAVNDKFWKELNKFGKMYQKGTIKLTDLKLLFKHNVEVSFAPLEKAEMLKLINFYMLFIEK